MTVTTLPLGEIAESKLNPRRDFAKEPLEELTESIRKVGVLQPVLVRPSPKANGKASKYELVAGHRRLRAAAAAGLAEIPVTVRELTDEQVLEAMVIENLHRADLHPLEEAEGYRKLHEDFKHSVEDLAAKVGKSVAYVYARLKLCELTKEAKKAFLEDRITAGHAILLARLKAEDQDRALDLETEAVFRFENLLFDPEGKADKWEGVTTCSVRELQQWIDMNVRLEPAEGVDQMFFPETAEVLEAAKAEEATVLAITREYMLPPERKGKVKTLTCNAWKRADGKGGSKKCEHARPAVVAIGAGRGEAFDVCTAKEKCKTHWTAEMREKAKRAVPGSKSSGSKVPDYKRQEEKWRLEREREEAARARWQKAVPAIAGAVAAAVTKAPTKAGGLLAKIILDELAPDPWERKHMAKIEGLVPSGTTAEDLVRHAAWCIISKDIAIDTGAPERFPSRAKAFGIDVKKLLDEHAPVEKKAPEKKPAKKK